MIVPPGNWKSDSSSESSAKPLASALELLRLMINAPEQQKHLNPDERVTTKMVYTNGVALWMLVVQRLGGGHTLSENSAAYSQARKRLPLETILEFSNRVCDCLGQISEPVIDGRRVFILDGTTITLAPTLELQKAYPPAPNQHGQSVWPVALLMVANEMQSGCALLRQVDPMYGENNASEAVQAHRIVNNYLPSPL